MVDRPNLFVKIPATLPGLVAIEEMISPGKSINVTLIFSLERYRGGPRLHQGPPKARRERRRPLRRALRGELLRLPNRHRGRHGDYRSSGPTSSRGELAIANAKLAYQIYKKVFGGARWGS